MSKTIKLRQLRPGQSFVLPQGGRKGILLYANDCRARVRLGSTKVEIKGREFSVSNETDWAPDTEVIPTKQKGGSNDVQLPKENLLSLRKGIGKVRPDKIRSDSEADAIFEARPEE